MVTAAVPKLQARRHWTFDQMAAELSERNSPTELWDGEIIMSPAPTPSHQDVVFNFATLLRNFVARKKLGKVFVSPIDVVLSQRRAVQPDVIYISKGRSSIIQEAIRGVPDLVAEVVSAGSWKRDRVDKKVLYEQFGVAEYWIIDPEAHLIEVFALGKRGYELHSRAELGETAPSRTLPGFAVSWDKLTT
jgi:Uma2 family endonuclease